MRREGWIGAFSYLGIVIARKQHGVMLSGYGEIDRFCESGDYVTGRIDKFNSGGLRSKRKFQCHEAQVAWQIFPGADVRSRCGSSSDNFTQNARCNETEAHFRSGATVARGSSS